MTRKWLSSVSLKIVTKYFVFAFFYAAVQQKQHKSPDITPASFSLGNSNILLKDLSLHLRRLKSGYPLFGLTVNLVCHIRNVLQCETTGAINHLPLYSHND